MGIGVLTGPADDGILLVSTIADDLGCWDTRALLGSGPQIANRLLGRAHLVRWTLEADEEFSMLRKSDLGNVDLLRTMPLPDSAANAGTPMPKNIADHEGRSLRAKSLQI